MNIRLGPRVDSILAGVTGGPVRVPGVIAMATDRKENIYEGSAGDRRLGHERMTADTVVSMMSCTKAFTATAVMQLVEEGLDLDAPARQYVGELGDIRVIEGFNASGQPILRAPKREITTRMLMLHTAGFAYAWANSTYLRLTNEHGLPSTPTGSKASIIAPLLFDPGDGWEYGINMEWAGLVVERIAGKRLGQVMQEKIFTPLGIVDTAFTLSPSMRSRLARYHQREPDGSEPPRFRAATGP